VEEEVYISSLAATQTQSHSYVCEALLISSSFEFGFSFNNSPISELGRFVRAKTFREGNHIWTYMNHDYKEKEQAGTPHFSTK
jgi:hypothetical protein